MININFTAENLNDLANQMSGFLAQIGGDKVAAVDIGDPVKERILVPVPTSAAATMPTAAPAPVQVSNPNSAVPAPVPAPAPGTSPAPTPVPAVPVSALPSFTFDQIATAGASLIDSGKMDALLGLLDKFGVQSLTQLTPEQYGAVATELRALGAQI